MAARDQTSEDVALSLTVAVVSSSPGPLLLLDGHLTVIAASLSFCDAFEASEADLAGQALYQLGTGEWDTDQLRTLMTATVSGDALTGPIEMDFQRGRRPSRHLIVQASRLDYLDLEQTRILIAVSDVTQTRAAASLKEEGLRQSSVLLQEVRHRVANSLQIIASVLMQDARKTESEETRGHLRDAHHRIMSVAALERLLSRSEDGDVEVHGYFTSLCESISASMMNGDQVSLTVDGGDGVVDARVSVSLGLIVTELVINALKHAFPNGRPGRITVDYSFQGPNWILCVRDDGVGMPTTGAAARTGLGTNIVQALAKQLNAVVEVVPAHPGTKVSIHHARIILVQDDPETAGEPLATPRTSARAIRG